MLKGIRLVVILDLIYSYAAMLAPHTRARGIMLKCHHFSGFSPHHANAKRKEIKKSRTPIHAA